MDIFFFEELTLPAPFFPRPLFDARGCSEGDSIEFWNEGIFWGLPAG